MITELKIHNFKSLRKVELSNIPSFMVLVGANSSGKSNFIKALQFLFSAMTKGLSKAIDEFGGYENICFRRMKRARGAIRFAIKYSFPFSGISAWIALEKEVNPAWWDSRVMFDYILEFKSSGETIGAPYSVTYEHLHCDIVNSEFKESWFSFTRKENKIDDLKMTNDKNLQRILGFIGSDARDFFLGRSIPSTELIVEGGFPFMLSLPISNYFKTCGAYHLTPDEARRPVDPSGADTYLAKFGGNLASVIRFLKQEQPEDFENIMEHARVAVSSIKDIDNRYTDNKLLSYKLAEEGVRRPWLPEDVSDGTIQSLCLFIPLEDKRINLAAYDEPENSAHPWIQKHFVKTCVQKSGEKQIILATHSIAALNEVPPESLYIINRNERGESNIKAATREHPQIKEIIEEKIMRLGEYWESGAIGGVPIQLEMEFDE